MELTALPRSSETQVLTKPPSRLPNAGEFNGFIKSKERLLSPRLPFEAGAVILPKDYRPTLDRAAIERFTVETACFE